jgi:hypothetical protein
MFISALAILVVACLAFLLARTASVIFYSKSNQYQIDQRLDSIK